MRSAARFGRALLALVIVTGTACNQEPASPRYAYVVTCDARVDKLDTVAGRKIASYDLAASSMKELLPPGNQAIDGCLGYHPVFDAAGGLLYFVAPAAANANADGKKEYRIFEFSAPDMKLVKTLPAPASQSEAP